MELGISNIPKEGLKDGVMVRSLGATIIGELWSV